MRRYNVKVNNKSLEVTLVSVNNNTVNFSIGGQNHSVTLEPILESASSAEQSQITSNQSEKQIKAPIPGIIISCPVKVGEQIISGQTLLVIEAMKMENNINAPVSGTIKAILIKQGQEVEAGQILLEFE